MHTRIIKLLKTQKMFNLLKSFAGLPLNELNPCGKVHDWQKTPETERVKKSIFFNCQLKLELLMPIKFGHQPWDELKREPKKTLSHFEAGFEHLILRIWVEFSTTIVLEHNRLK